jgi:hypothetical protein
MTERKIREPALVQRVHIPKVITDAAIRLHWALLRARPNRLRLRVLFVLSHQRSGSSLLVHCLNTNPKVLGYGETLIHYASERDFRRLPLMVMARTRKLVALQRYVVDKLLYDELIEDPHLLRSENLQTIFLVREPKGALQSLIQAPELEGWPQRIEANRDHVDQEIAARYYCDRLETLEEYARTINDKKHSLFITFDQLLERTGDVFIAFQRLLQIHGSFSEQYEILRTTGASGHGDVSANIKQGFVDRQIQRRHCTLRRDLLERANAAFDRCCTTLREHCTHLPGAAGGGTAPANESVPRGMTSHGDLTAG